MRFEPPISSRTPRSQNMGLKGLQWTMQRMGGLLEWRSWIHANASATQRSSDELCWRIKR